VGIDLSGIVIIVGNYGSGKTEVAVNLAMHQHRRGTRVRIADLDLVNPYFRTREARTTLKAMGVEVVLPPEHLMQADLPILMPQVAGLLRSPGGLIILDAGGDDAGATVLASLSDVFDEKDRRVQMLQVVNPFRPSTTTVDGCLKMRSAIEARARRTVTHWVGNAHMLDDTTVEHLYQGGDFMASLEAADEVTVAFVTAPHHLVPELEMDRMRHPVLPIHRQLVPPWRKAEKPPGVGAPEHTPSQKE
jgi:RecA/RadA recombinase